MGVGKCPDNKDGHDYVLIRIDKLDDGTQLAIHECSSCGNQMSYEKGPQWT